MGEDFDFGRDIGKTSLKIKAIKLRPAQPFQWASGYMMPIYNDNRMLLGRYEHRKLVALGFENEISRNGIVYDVIAGTSTAGIPHAECLADLLKAPMIYVRDKPKDHGMKNQIEGIDAESDLEGKKVILIEDLISTGGSSVKAVQAIRNANGKIDHCLSIFNYGFKEAENMFSGERPYDDASGARLDPKCDVHSLLTYDKLLEVAVETGYLEKDQVELLREWRADPFSWGEKRGFPKVVKDKK